MKPASANFDSGTSRAAAGHDIPERDALHKNEVHFGTLFDLAPIPLVFSNHLGDVTHINRHFSRLFSYSLADIPNIAVWWLRAYPDENYRRQVIATWDAVTEKARATHTDIEPMEYSVTCKDGLQGTGGRGTVDEPRRPADQAAPDLCQRRRSGQGERQPGNAD